MHARLAGRRVNRVNMRREFFNATLAEAKRHLLEPTGELLQYDEMPQALEFQQSRTSASTDQTVQARSLGVRRLTRQLAQGCCRCGCQRGNRTEDEYRRCRLAGQVGRIAVPIALRQQGAQEGQPVEDAEECDEAAGGATGLANRELARMFRPG
jgi:hypothetical protein